MSYSRPSSSILCRSSRVGGGGGDEGSVAGTPGSSKSPSNPAGTMNSNVPTVSLVSFFQACSVLLGMASRRVRRGSLLDSH